MGKDPPMLKLYNICPYLASAAGNVIWTAEAYKQQQWKLLRQGGSEIKKRPGTIFAYAPGRDGQRMMNEGSEAGSSAIKTMSPIFLPPL